MLVVLGGIFRKEPAGRRVTKETLYPLPSLPSVSGFLQMLVSGLLVKFNVDRLVHFWMTEILLLE
jgi:hypothetical protein